MGIRTGDRLDARVTDRGKADLVPADHGDATARDMFASVAPWAEFSNRARAPGPPRSRSQPIARVTFSLAPGEEGAEVGLHQTARLRQGACTTSPSRTTCGRRSRRSTSRAPTSPASPATSTTPACASCCLGRSWGPCAARTCSATRAARASSGRAISSPRSWSVTAPWISAPSMPFARMNARTTRHECTRARHVPSVSGQPLTFPRRYRGSSTPAYTSSRDRLRLRQGTPTSPASATSRSRHSSPARWYS